MENEAQVIVDFSENFGTKSQNDVQQAFFGKNQIGLFTAVAYIGPKKAKSSYIIANDDASHSKHQVYFYLKLFIDDLKTRNSALSKIFVVSDGAASQFKNCFILTTIMTAESDFGIELQWDFSPTSHGKSPADGLGGNVKRCVESRVMSGKFEVYTAKDFIDCASTFCIRVTLRCVTSVDMKETNDILDQRWKSTKVIQGSCSFHHFRRAENGKDLMTAVSTKLDGVKIFKNRK